MKTGNGIFRIDKVSLTLTMLLFIAHSVSIQAQTEGDSIPKEKKYQARPPATQPFGKEAFEKSDNTVLRWLGMAGFLINSHGTTIMVDPLLKGFDMPIMIDFPIKTEDVPELDAILVTHADNDHYSVPTNKSLAGVTKGFYSTVYVDSLMTNEGFPSHGHDIGDTFDVGPVQIKLTAADHAYQNAYPGDERSHF